MSDLPNKVEIHEEGPREGFQIEPGPISSDHKIELIEALAETGLHHIQICSFVSQRIVPGWADADEVVERVRTTPGVDFTALWFNDKGLARALKFRDKLKLYGSIALSASEGFSYKNLHRSRAQNMEAMRAQTALHLSNGIPVTRIGVMAAFGCNFQGEVTVDEVLQGLADGFALAEEAGATITDIGLADTMGWAVPPRIERVVGAVRERWPDQKITLHLHDTRGMGVANAHAGLRMGVSAFDSTVGGLGGCPYAPGASGNICSEDAIHMLDAMGFQTGIDLARLLALARELPAIVGHEVPGQLAKAGRISDLHPAPDAVAGLRAQFASAA